MLERREQSGQPMLEQVVARAPSSPDAAARQVAWTEIGMRLWLTLLSTDLSLPEALEHAGREAPELYRAILVRAAETVRQGGVLYEVLAEYQAFVDESFLHACWVGARTGNLIDALEYADQEAYFYEPANPRSELCHIGGLLDLWQRAGLLDEGLAEDAWLDYPLARELAADSEACGQAVRDLVRQRLIAGVKRDRAAE